MKKLSAILALGLLVAGIAYAAPSIDKVRRDFWGGLTIGAAGIAGTAGNIIKESLGASATYDAASITATCDESSAITVTGAAVGDPCMVGVPVAAGALNVSWTCYVSAADAVKVKVCNPTAGAINPTSGTFYVRTFSSQ